MFRVKAVFVVAVMFLFVVAAAPVLVLFARSRRGRIEGTFGVALGTFLVSGLVWLCAPLVGAERPFVAGVVALTAAVAFVPLGALASALMRPCDYGEGPVGSHFLRAEPTPESVGWADVEDEYAWILVRLVTHFDPRVPTAEGRAARARVNELLAAIAERPEYRNIARISDGQSYRLLSGELDLEHCYSYRPEPRSPDERLGLLVFLHGHGSNYLFFVHALRPLCDRMRVALVAPSFGYGNWEAPGGTEAVERAARFGVSAIDPDPGRVFLGGISQGGAGVSRAAAAHPELFAGLIFISPTMEASVIGSEAFAEGWRGRPVLVVQGERDRNVRPESVTAACELMEAAGVSVAQHRDPDGGHFLFLAKLDEVTEVIAAWARGAINGAR
ncbi:MAG: alpha/beta fold hydrolase [Planctomycetes bacterium]|nr:alpha/beta fold hydrolase [Planctomycetota bacterium]